jgi:hypothetical protein
MNEPSGPSSSSSRPTAGPSSQSGPAVYVLDDDDDDPFVTHHYGTISNPFRPQAAAVDYDAEPFAYANNPHARASTASLISSRRASSVSTYTHDDSTHLTSNLRPHHKVTDEGGDWRTDSEHLADAATPRSRRRRTQRYSANLSPIERSGSVIKRISRSLRRVSWRVVNFAGAGLEDRILLSGGDDDSPPDSGQGRPIARDDDDDDDEVDRPVESYADLGKILPVRGRTLGLFGPTSRIRRAMYDVLIFPCVFVPTRAALLPDAVASQMD